MRSTLRLVVVASHPRRTFVWRRWKTNVRKNRPNSREVPDYIWDIHVVRTIVDDRWIIVTTSRARLTQVECLRPSLFFALLSSTWFPR